MTKFDVFYDRRNSGYSGGKVQSRKDILEKMPPSKVPDEWVSQSQEKQRQKKIFKTVTKAFIWLCKQKHSENMELTEIQNGWNSKGEGTMAQDETET